jgi:multicomponent Na+:H+ antiporter subunit D
LSTGGLAGQLPALQVVVPLVAAPLSLVLNRSRACWILAVLTAWCCFAISQALLSQVLDSGTIRYAMGGWAAPWGIEYVIDTTSAYVLVIVTGIAAVTMPFAGPSVLREIRDERVPLFYTLMLLCLTGLAGMVVTGDAFNLFVFLEISSLSTYAIISLGRDRRSLTAAFQYLIMGTIGGTFVLIGVGLVYAITGTLNMADLAARLPEAARDRSLNTAFAFIAVGMGLKIAVFPLHLWLPNAYTYAPSAATVFLAGTSTKVAVYALLRFIFTVFSPAIDFEGGPFREIFAVLGIAGLLSASVVAIFQDDVKRMLAYSSVAQLGYIVLGVSYGTAAGVTAGLLHLFNHALIKTALFMAVGCVFYRIGSTHLPRFRGLARHMPFTFAAFVAGGLAIIGVPLTTGFVSKWYLVLAALEAGHWPVVAIILLGSLLAVVYIWRIVEIAWFEEPDEATRDVGEAPALMLASTWFLVVANIWYGINTDLTVGVASQAADLLTGAGR